MGTVYVCPLFNRTFEVWNGWTSISNLTSNQLESLYFIRDNGFNYYNGLILNTTINATSWIVSNGVLYLAYYKQDNTVAKMLSYSPIDTTYTSAGISTDNNCRCSSTFRSSGYFVSPDNSASIVAMSRAGVDLFDSYADAYTALSAYEAGYPITYRLTNCTAPTAPTEAAVGTTVTVVPQFTSGYGVVNPSSDAYVTNNGVVIPSSYSNGTLTFTMPDPS